MPRDTLTRGGATDTQEGVDPQAARAQIERTRARMSETIDEIEEVLLRKKEEIQHRLDIGAPIRERPLPSLGMALGAGLVLGFLTGGDDHDGGYSREIEERADTWEVRARRLLRIAQEQEAALRRLGVEEEEMPAISWDPDPRLMRDGEDGSEGPSRLDEAREMIAERVANFLGHTISQVFSAPRS